MRNAQTFQRMEMPPLRVGNVPFTDGNAAARTFGRAHRHRPYHFSCGSVSQGCRRIVCRWTKTKKVAGRGSADGLKQEKVAGRGSADGLKRKRSPEEAPPTDKTPKACRSSRCRPKKTRNACRKSRRRQTKTKNDCRKSLCRRTENKKNRRNGKFLRSDFGLMRKKAYFYATFCDWT